jgi:[acyl-carrier-protein] S-malonyltransferase
LSGKSNYVFLFPGQGAQSSGMSLDFLKTGNTEIVKLFELSSKVTGKDMEALLRDSDAETLKRTDVSQPAITLANLAAAAYLAGLGIKPSACAGFSLGEYAALAAAGVLSTEDCFNLVKVRGKAMQEASDKLSVDSLSAGGAPGMAAVLGLAPEKVEALIAEWTAAGLKDLYAANINSSRQLVISGTAASLAEAETRFKEAGARRVIRLQVAGPFHSPLMAGAAEAFRPFLEKTSFHDPVIPLYANVTGKKISSGEEAKSLAIRQITEAVRWTSTEAAMIACENIDAVLEAGPGTVLQGLWEKTESGIPCYNAGSIQEIEKWRKEQ